MKNFPIPEKAQLSPANQAIFDQLKGVVGYVPNLYAAMANSEHALGNYLTFQNGKTSLSPKEREVINLVVSQYNHCVYCISAHTAVARMLGFDEGQILDIRRADIPFDHKLDALAKLVNSIVENQGHAEQSYLDGFYGAGYTHGSLIDVVSVIGDKTITNYLHALIKVPVDWPVAPELT